LFHLPRRFFEDGWGMGTDAEAAGSSPGVGEGTTMLTVKSSDSGDAADLISVAVSSPA